MTLLRELAVSLTVFLCLLFAGSLAMDIRDARRYLQAQLQSHAQDTATSLGVAIASTAAGDVATIDTMIDAVFDRGYYRTIRFSDMSGRVLVNSEHPVTLEDVPHWFVSLVELKAPEVTTEVNRGWVPAGILYIASHPGYAYQNLWKKVRNDTVLFALGLLLAIVALNLFLSIVLRPLKRLEQQANAICQRRFEVQPELPKTRDLRQVVQAMNRMAGKLEQLFNEKVILTEELRKQSVKDMLTGILNNRAFTSRVNSVLEQERGEAGGTFMLIHTGDMETLAQQQGQQAVDQLQVAMARRLEQTLAPWPQAILGRRDHCAFAVFLPACGFAESKHIAEGCFQALAALHFFVSKDGREQLHLASVTHIGQCQLQALLEHAEQVLQDLQLQGHNNWQAREVGETAGHAYLRWHDSQWQAMLERTLANEQVALFAQQAFDTDQRPLFREVLARLSIDDHLISAEAFLPMVERFNLHALFDQAVLNCLINHMERVGQDQSYCVNLSPRSLVEESFFNWLLQTLKSKRALCQRLILETPESILLQTGDQLKQRIDQLTATGCRFSLDHFGTSSQLLDSLQRLNVHYIKIDSSFIRGIAENQGNQFYIRTLAMLANSRDITLLAQGVEHKAEWIKLQHLGVQGGQGFYLARPAAL